MNTKTYTAVNCTVGLVVTFEASGYRKARRQLARINREAKYDKIPGCFVWDKNRAKYFSKIS